MAGYEDRIFDYRTIAVESGYWSGYWSASKKPKSLKTILTRVLAQHDKRNEKGKHHSDEVDVEAFLAREARFKQMQQQERA